MMNSTDQASAPLLTTPTSASGLTSLSALRQWSSLPKAWARATFYEVLWLVRVVLVLALACNTLFVGLGIVVIPFLVFEFSVALALLAGVATLYTPTYLGDPATTGRRRWEAFRKGFVIRDIIRWFKGDVVKTVDLPHDKQYLFAFAPHGIMVMICSLYFFFFFCNSLFSSPSTCT